MKNKRIYAIILLVLLIGFFIAFLTMKKESVNPPTPNSLTLTTSPWSGWSTEQPSDSTQEITQLRVGNEITLKGLSADERYILKIIDIGSDEITLSVNGLSLKQGKDLEKKGIDLRGCKLQKFSMKKGELVELDTCSMDAGVNYKIRYN